MNKFTTLVIAGITLVLFQNAALYQSYFFSMSAEDSIVAPFDTFEYKAEVDTYLGKITSTKTKRVHEAKVQGAGLPPLPVRYKETKVWNFQIDRSDSNAIKSDRSEIRMVGSDAQFNQDYYMSFKFFIPSTATSIQRSDGWALIWQCQQIGNANQSPPISLHIEDDVLSLTTIQDYQPWSSGRPRHDSQPLVNLQRDRWYKVMLRFRLGSNGAVTAWINGQKLTTLNAYYNSKKSVSIKYQPIGMKDVYDDQGTQRCTSRIGIYKAPAVGHYRAVIGDFKFGTDYNAVRP